MSILSDKYKIPEPVIKNMMSDGVISSKYAGWDEVFQLYKAGKSTQDIADIAKISERQVLRIIAKLK